MAQNSSISLSIGAQDRFSKTLNALEGRINKMTAPVKRFQNNVSRLSNFGPAQLARGMERVGRTATGAARSLGSIVPVLGTITGAASIAGVYRLSSAWARFGQQLGITSRTIGVAPQRLQAMQGAARIAGGTAEGMTSALQGLAQTKFNIRAGLDPAALAQFQQFGVTLSDIQRLAPDQLFDKVLSKLRQIKDPVAQAAAATKIFGGGASAVIPILQQSSGAYQRNLALSERYGVLNERGIKSATDLAESQSRLELAVRGFGNSLAESVAPILTPIVNKMSEWIAANRQWIATDIAGRVQSLVRWFSDGGWDRITKWASDFAARTERIVQAVGGWKTAAVGAAAAVALLFAAPLLAGLAGTLLALIKIRKELRGIGKDGDSLGGRGRKGGGWLGKLAGAGMLYDAANNFSENGKSKSLDQYGRDFVSDTPLVGDVVGNLWDATRPGGSVENGVKSLFGVKHGGAADKGINWLFGDKLTNRAYDPNEGYNQRIYSALHKKVSGSNPQARAIQSALQRNGFNGNQIAGIIANWSQESSLNPSANNGSHAGLAQWDRDRQAQFQRRYGHAITAGSVDEQVDFFSTDLKKHKAAEAALAAARSPEEAAFAVGRHYEIPGVTDATLRPDVNARAHAATDWAQALAGPASAPPQRVEITIAHHNAPAGASVRVAKSSPGVAVTGVRTHQAMDPAASSL